VSHAVAGVDDVNKDLTFDESVVMQAALGEDSTTEQICTELATGTTDGKFCLACIIELEVDGLTFSYFSEEGDCGLCKHQCLTLVAPTTTPIDYGVLTHDQVCAFCTFADTVTKGSFQRVGDQYSRGLRDMADPDRGLSPTTVYGKARWHVSGVLLAEYSLCSFLTPQHMECSVLRMLVWDRLGNWIPEQYNDHSVRSMRRREDIVSL
jgi:hypothetical protein